MDVLVCVKFSILKVVIIRVISVVMVMFSVCG